MEDEQKRQYLPGLWVVATPIGNLGDLAPRAREALKRADTILCEDTRRTACLTAVLEIETPLERLDAHAGPKAIEKAVKRLLAGESLALVTDAGTPAVSDPGSALVEAAREAGVTVTPFPGASAVMTLLSVAGFHETPFTFRGFFPRKNGERTQEIERARGSEVSRVFVWFESPERIQDSIEFVEKIQADARIVAAKELTKIHEKIFAGSAADVSRQIRGEIEREGARGEWCFTLYLQGNPVEEFPDLTKILQCLLDARVSASEAARQVSQHFGIPKKQVYERALELSGKKMHKGG